jgi:hypothetical protein
VLGNTKQRQGCESNCRAHDRHTHLSRTRLADLLQYETVVCPTVGFVWSLLESLPSDGQLLSDDSPRRGAELPTTIEQRLFATLLCDVIREAARLVRLPSDARS